MASFLERLRARPERSLVPLGAAVLIAGLTLSRFAALRATADLHAGETLQRLPDGRALPCALRLEAVAVDGAEGAPRLLLRQGEEEVAMDPAEGATASVHGTRVTVVKALTAATPETTFRERSGGPGNPVAHLLLGLGTPAPLEGYLVAKDPERRRFDEPGGRFSVILAENWDPALLDRLRARPGTLSFTVGGHTFTHAAQAGDWAFPTFTLRIVDVFPDLGVTTGPDGAPKAFHRSRLPRNPWVLLRLTQKGGQAADLLVAADPPKDPSYASALAASLPPGADLRYDRAGEELISRFVVLTADGQARLVEGGRLLRTEPLSPGQPFIVAKGLSVTVLERLPHGEMQIAYRTATPGMPGEPALELRTEGRSGTQTCWAGLGRPEVEVPGTDLRARFGPPAPALDALRARITALDAGERPILARTLSGTDTLDVEGLTVSLGRGASQAGRWVRLSLRRDPWWMLWTAGLAMMAVGLLIAFFRPKAPAMTQEG